MHISPASSFLVVGLANVMPGSAKHVGGKAANLGVLIQKGFRVPPGFVITTDAYDLVAEGDDLGKLLDEIEAHAPADEQALKQTASGIRGAVLSCQLPRSVCDAVADSYAALCERGHSQVAVRSSSTAEDLADASFAGQYDTCLNVSGIENILDALRRCWASLWSDRAVRYRLANSVPGRQVKIAVIVQAMVDARVAGVLYTLNPLTGNRTEMVVEAANGLGEAVVSGTIVPDLYVIPQQMPDELPHGCLSQEDLATLRDAGCSLEIAFGSPQDAEWAIDGNKQLWLTQSRPVTTVFPVPASPSGELRAYWSVSVYQGLSRPFTPIGAMMIRQRQKGMQRYMSASGFAADIVDVDGWLYWDITEGVCDDALRPHMSAFADSLAAPSGQIIASLAKDPRFAKRLTSSAMQVKKPRKRWEVIIPALIFPTLARRRVHRWAKNHLNGFTVPANEATPEQRLAFVENAYPRICRVESDIPRGANTAGGIAPQLAAGLLGDAATVTEINATFRGVPHNPTTEMDLSLWQLATDLFNDPASRRLLFELSATELAERFGSARLSATMQRGVAAFLKEYGCRTSGEIDFGVPRWSDDPQPLFVTLASYARSVESGSDARAHFDQAKREAERHIDELADRLPPQKFIRKFLVRQLLHNARELRGLRELPKFQLMKGFAILRSQLVLIGEDLRRSGKLDDAEDIMFLNPEEIRNALGNWNPAAIVAQRRAVYQRECKRRHIPAVVISDGTIPELPQAATSGDDECLQGLAAAAGTVTGRARVVHDPDTAQILAGEILVCPSTDPGWTPLFLTASALVTETGGMTSHGTTVAREYGIPAVVGVINATRRIGNGQTITVNGSHGTIMLHTSGHQPPA